MLLCALAPQVQAGTVTLEKLDVFDYFNSFEGRWSGTIQAKSSVPWPNWMAYQGSVTFDDVIESGLMAYRCNGAVSGGCTISDPDVHRFIFTGPATPAYPLLGVKVVITDAGGAANGFKRTWSITSAEDAIQTVAHYPFSEFTAVNDEPLMPVGYTLTFHMADVDTIDAMLAGQFGSPLAHRSSQPCIPLRVVGGMLSSTQCHK